MPKRPRQRQMSQPKQSFIPAGNERETDVTISSPEFYPDLSTAGFRAAMRVGTTVPTERVKTALIDALLKTLQDMKDYRVEFVKYATLADVPDDEIDGTSIKVHLFLAAVHNEAKASLTEVYRDFDSTKSGHDEADKLEMTIEDYRRVARESIRALLGRPRATIELL